jgi:hypothetical protein
MEQAGPPTLTLEETQQGLSWETLGNNVYYDEVYVGPNKTVKTLVYLPHVGGFAKVNK